MTASRASDTLTPDAKLRSLIDEFTPVMQKLIRSIRSALRTRFPTANELAYDYGQHLVINYSPTDKSYHGLVTLDARPDGVRLYFMQGSQLPDAKGLLRGKGKEARYVGIDTLNAYAHPDVQALVAAVIQRAPVPMPADGKGQLVIKSTTSAKRTAREAR